LPLQPGRLGQVSVLSALALVVVAFLTLGFVTTAVFLACFWS
jgi:hypothetical protein